MEPKNVRLIVSSIAAAWLAFSLVAFCDIQAIDWRWWAILMPVVVLYNIAIGAARQEDA